MMSIAEVISMAKAELLVVMLNVRGRHGRTYNYDVGRPKIDVEEQAQLFFQVGSSYMGIVRGVHVERRSSCW